jgi:integrase
MRNLRVLFNIAINEKKVKAEYPFKKHKIKGAQGRKIALSANQIRMIANYETAIPQERFYRDMFMFSFLGNGINLSDIARLRYSDYDGDEISFVREKTKGKDTEVKLRFTVTDSLRRIIKEHGTPSVGHDGYMFPILRPGWAEEREYAEIKQFTKQLNKYIRRIAGALKIGDPVSSYTARHSWATIAMNSGASVEYIKESLGHSSVAVTERYLNGFEKSTRREHSEKIERSIFNQNAG